MEKFGLSQPLLPVTQALGGGESGEGMRQEPIEKSSLVSGSATAQFPLPHSTHTQPRCSPQPLAVSAATDTASSSQGLASLVGSRVTSPPELGPSPLPGSLGETGVPMVDMEAGSPGLANKNTGHSLSHAIYRKLFVIFSLFFMQKGVLEPSTLKFKFNWESSILSGDFL